MSLLSILAFVLGGITLVYGLRIVSIEQDKLRQYQYIKKQKKLSIAEVKALYQSYIEEMKIPLGFALLVELEGYGKSSQLLSPTLQVPCIYFDLKIIRKVQYQSSGRIFEEAIFTQEKISDFYLEDNSQEQLLIKSKEVSKGFWKDILGEAAKTKKSKLPQEWNIQEKTLPEGTILYEYIMEEKTITLHNNFYVFGEIREFNGNLILSKALHQPYKLWVAPQSKKDFLANTLQNIRSKISFAYFFIILGLILLVFAIWIF